MRNFRKLWIFMLVSGISSAPTGFGGKGLYRIRSAENEWIYKRRPVLDINLHFEGLERIGDTFPEKGYFRVGITYVFNPFIESYLLMRGEVLSDLKEKLSNSEIVKGRGDTDIGVKLLIWNKKIMKFSPGLDLTLPTGDTLFSYRKYIIAPYSAFTFNLGEILRKHILNLHLNLKYRIGDEVSPFRFGTAGEIHSDFLSYFIELTKGHRIDNGWRFSPGLRFHPKPWFNIDLIIDFGISKNVPDYGINVGFSFLSPVIREREILPTGNLIGKVIDSLSGEPVKALVEISELKEETFSDKKTGIFKFIGIPEGLYSIKISADGYKPFSKPFTIKKGEMKNVSFYLSPIEVSLKIKVLNEENNPLKDVSLLAEGRSSRKAMSDSSGNILISLLTGNYTLYLKKKGYKDKKISIDVKSDTSLQLVLEKPRGSILFEGTVYFDYGKAIIRDDQKPVLDSAGRILKLYPSSRCELRGHTDKVGGLQYNYTLSLMRAYAVRDYLMKKYFIEKDRISVLAFSKTQTVYKEPSKNRRVEIFIIK